MSVYNCGKEEKKCIADKSVNLQNKKTQQSGGKNLLAGLDRDTLLTAAVMLLMIKNGGDMRLILALGYIIAGGSFGK
ncbi:MAG: hypothetical protein IKK66_01220 [Ruminococcus sp.]|nr:hypothetical protein [Ruminococcus sp.]